jgi:methylase of polypeptide subunit release factors
MQNTHALLADTQPLNLTDLSAIALFAEILRRHNYTPYALFEALGEDHGTTLNRVDIPLYLRRLRDTPLHHLIRLFLLGVPVERAALTTALAPLSSDVLATLGLAHVTDDLFTSPYRITAFANLLLVCDRFLLGDTLRPDFVTGVNQTSINLAALTIRQAGRALDLGTGCGIQALLASRHCEHVIATDLNPRALAFARFNAALNEVSNVEWRMGSLFEPVTDEQFDLIVCNPPYVISPQTDYIFRNAGLRGDAVSRLVITEAPRHLRAGGLATILCDWIHTRDEAWWMPLEMWVANSDCDALFLCHRTTNPLNYAAGWTRQPAPPNADTLDQLLNEWLAYYAELGVRAISGGAVILRRSAGPHWTYAASLSDSPRGDCGEQLQRMFAAQDYLRRLPHERALLSVVFASLDGRIDQTLSYREGEWRAAGMRWYMPHGLDFEGMLDAFSIQLLMAFDGRQRLDPLIVQVAQNMGVSPPSLRHDALQLVRHWVEVGLIAAVM